MWDDESDIDQIREGVKRRLRYRRSPVPLVIIAVVVAMIIANVLSTVGTHTINFPEWLPGLIGFLIFMRIFSSLRRRNRYQRRAEPDDDAIERAVRRELRRRGYDDTGVDEGDDEVYLEKPKRGAPPMKRKNDAEVRLGDDGELIYDEDSPEESEMPSHNY